MADLTYTIGNDPSDHKPNARFDFPEKVRVYGENWSLLADDLAADFYDNHDGWECKFPLELRIYRDGSCVACFDVEMEFEPSFSAWEKELPALTSEPKP